MATGALYFLSGARLDEMEMKLTERLTVGWVEEVSTRGSTWSVYLE